MSLKLVQTMVLSCLLCLTGLSLGIERQFVLDGEAEGDQAGDAVAVIDFNADGFDDFVIGAPASDAGGISSGKIYIYYGGPGADDVTDIEIVGPSGSFFGSSIANAGDVNNDTYADLIVGAPYYSVIASRAGAAYIFFGGPSPDTTVDLALFGAASLDYYGTAVIGNIDFNGDGNDDFAVGAFKADFDAYENAGWVAVHYGSASPDTISDLTLAASADGERFGFALAAGNFNGDGYGDLAVGAYSFDDWNINLGRAYIFHGGMSPDSIFDYAVGGEVQGAYFGYSMDAADLGGDGFDDLLVGAYGYKIGQAEAGKIYVYEGAASMDTIADYSHNLGNSAPDNLGFDVTCGADIDGNFIQDFWAGYPGGDGGIIFNGGGYAVDTILNGESSGEEFGHIAALSPSLFGTQKPGIVVGALAYNNYRGRVYVYKQDNSSGNQPPVLDPIGDQSVAENANLNFVATAYDPDGTIPTMTSSTLPTGATYTDNLGGTGTFDWTPDFTQEGIYSVTFYTSDGVATDSEVVSITVTNTNREPVLDPIGLKSVIAESNLNFGITAYDPDGTIPDLDVSALPSGATFTDNNNGTGSFNWTPTTAQIGTHQTTFYAWDGEFIDSEQITIDVIADAVGCGDANADQQVNVGDPVFLISYIFSSGPAPNPLCRANANGDLDVNVGDVVYLISYIFRGGDPPVDPCCP